MRAALWAASRTGGLVDPTVLDDLEAAGYRESWDPERRLDLRAALDGAPARAAARPRPPREQRWQLVTVDDDAGTITRPAGLRLDTGGTGKGHAAERASELLAGYDAWAVDCGGDLRIGGDAGLVRDVEVEHPFSGETLATIKIRDGAVATSGLRSRIWRGEDGDVRHHLLDPSTGRPAFTGLVAVTALAPSAVEAEALAKAALLCGPRGARASSPRHGGITVAEDGAVDRIGRLEPAPRVRFRLPTPRTSPRGAPHDRSGSPPLRVVACLALRGHRLHPRRLRLGDHRPDDGQRPAPQGLGRPDEEEARRRSTSRRRSPAWSRSASTGSRCSATSSCTRRSSQIAVPFTMGYRPAFTGLGIIAGWLAVFLGLSFYARRRIGVKRWRSIHRATIAVWALGVIHTLGAGTDAGQPGCRRSCCITGIPIVYLFLRRMLPSKSAPRAAPQPPVALAGRARAASGAAPQPAPAPAPDERAARAGPDRGRPMSAGVVIAGGGLAAQRSAEALRRGGYEGRVRIVSDELHAPYDRPPLSKDFLSGERRDRRPAPAPGGLARRERRRARARRRRRRPGRRRPAPAARVGPRARLTSTSSSRPAAGRARFPGAEGYANVFTLRSLDDALALRAALRPARALAVLGAGLIGQEVAATARKRRRRASTLIEAEPLPLARALHPELAAWIVGVQREEGVDVLLGARVEQLVGDGDTLEALRARRRHARRARRAARRDRDRARRPSGSAPTCTSSRPPELPRRRRRRRRQPLGAGDALRAAPSRTRSSARPPLPTPVTTWWSDVHGVRIQGLGDPRRRRAARDRRRPGRALVHRRRLPRRRARRRHGGRAPARGAAAAQAPDRRPDTPRGGRMTLVPTIDDGACAAHGDCVEIAPTVFSLEGDVAEVIGTASGRRDPRRRRGLPVRRDRRHRQRERRADLPLSGASAPLQAARLARPDVRPPPRAPAHPRRLRRAVRAAADVPVAADAARPRPVGPDRAGAHAARRPQAPKADDGSVLGSIVGFAASVHHRRRRRRARRRRLLRCRTQTS